MITAAGLTKEYGPKRVVDNLSFTVRPGIVTGFLGPNGAGKSTTMRMILGLDNPTSGTATVNGTPYAQLQDPLRQVGGLLDAKWVHPNRSARSHLRWMAAANGIPVRRVDEVLGMVGLSDVAGKRAGQFSLGMSQRLGIAGALIGDPGVLLFDEPVNGLDPEGIVWVRNFIRALAAQGRTVLVSSHLLSEMALTADHLVVIGQGRLIADATVQQITETARKSVRVRSPQLQALAEAVHRAGFAVRIEQGPKPVMVVDNADSDPIGDIAAANSIVLHELTSKQASLEEAFMAMTAGTVEYQAGPGSPGPGQPGPGQPGHPAGGFQR